MTPGEYAQLKGELDTAATEFVSAFYGAIKENIFCVPEVAQTFQKLQNVFGKMNRASHVVIESVHFQFIYFPLGTGEPQMLIKKVSHFTEADKEMFKSLGIKLDPDNPTPPVPPAGQETPPS